jgi:broad specificity phosphatase PhoE
MTARSCSAPDDDRRHVADGHAGRQVSRRTFASDPVTPCRLVLVRHGHTRANGGGTAMRLSGWTDVPLSEEGVREAALAAEQLRRGPPLAAVWVSPLLRARDTARHLRRAPGVPLVIDPDLREIGCGEADGRTVDEVRAAFPDHWARNARQDDDDFRWPGGESYRELRARCVGAVRRIAARHPGNVVAVFTHTGVITQVIGATAGSGPRAGRRSATEGHTNAAAGSPRARSTAAIASAARAPSSAS